MSSDRERAERRELLKGYLEHTPPAANIDTINKVRDFKKAITNGKRVYAKATASLHEISTAINAIHKFWT